MVRRHTAGLLARIGGKALPETLTQTVAWASVEETRHSSASCELGFRDPGCELPRRTGLRLGSPLELVARTGTGSSELFTGEITGCEVVAGESGTYTVLRAEDLSHRLRRGRRVTFYRQMAASEIAAKLAQKAGLKRGRIDSTPLVYEHLAQAGESDWDFLRRLARESGHDVFVRTGALHFRTLASASEAPSPRTRAEQSPLVLEYGQNLLKVRSTASLRHQVTGVQVRGWDPDAGKALVAERKAGRTASRDVPWRPGGDAVRGEPLLLTSLPRTGQNEAEHVAAAMAQEVAAGLTGLHAVVGGAPELRVRSAVTLTGLGDGFDGRYTATSVRHEFHPDTGYLTEVTVREGDGPAGEETRPGDPEAAAPRLAGLVCGLVKDIKDPMKLGRVKLTFPWLSDDYESDWARTVQTGGTKDGGIVSPEVGDEVLVGFEQGSLDRPYVIGGLYSKQRHPGSHAVDAFYDGTKGVTNVRSFVSRTGQRLELLDADGGPKGVLMATGNGKLRLELNQARSTVTVSSTGDVEITSSGAVKVKGSKGISLDAGTGALELKGGKVDLSGTSVNVEGKGITTIKGSMIKLN
ncbi:VgrG-related protein [Streptomyces sp. NPDC001262]|uniref:VgrG-related protein n=1 Tax=Streptomyces TaxID=1883 RepID=UPI00369B0477